MSGQKPWSHGALKPALNGKFIEHSDGTPFFWLGDTGWLLFSRLNRREAREYFDDRKAKGFNVIQVMLVHSLPAKNVFGRTLNSLEDTDWKQGPPMAGKDDYWALSDEYVRMAEECGLYMAMVPVWGAVVREGHLSPLAARSYGTWLGSYFKNHPNIIWLNGGDIRGDTHRDVWIELATAIKEQDPEHLMTFHPFGRTRSASWFHSESWLDFNMFQSGHRRYDQESVQATASQNDDNLKSTEVFRGEDNWKYVLEDLDLTPKKPTIDGEPSYEGIPQGLHDPAQPVWQAADIRRYAYWSVFAGAFGHTYGNNAVMQMHKPEYAPGSFSVSKTWHEALDDPGAGQMQFLRKLMESFDYGKGQYSPQILQGEPGEKYNRFIATRGPGYALIYAYIPRPIAVDLTYALPEAKEIYTYWFFPASGTIAEIGVMKPVAHKIFDPKTRLIPGEDRVLILTDRRYDGWL